MAKKEQDKFCYFNRIVSSGKKGTYAVIVEFTVFIN